MNQGEEVELALLPWILLSSPSTKTQTLTNRGRHKGEGKTLEQEDMRQNTASSQHSSYFFSLQNTQLFLKVMKTDLERISYCITGACVHS